MAEEHVMVAAFLSGLKTSKRYVRITGQRRIVFDKEKAIFPPHRRGTWKLTWRPWRIGADHRAFGNGITARSSGDDVGVGTGGRVSCRTISRVVRGPHIEMHLDTLAILSHCVAVNGSILESIADHIQCGLLGQMRVQVRAGRTVQIA